MEASLRTSIASGLPGSRARSAVFLVHAESPRQAPGGQNAEWSAGRLALRKRMLSHGECERPVTSATYQWRTGRRLEKSSVQGLRPASSWVVGYYAPRSGLAKKSALSLTSIHVAVNSPRCHWRRLVDVHGPHSGGFASSAIGGSRSTCRLEIWKARIPPGARCLR